MSARVGETKINTDGVGLTRHGQFNTVFISRCHTVCNTCVFCLCFRVTIWITAMWPTKQTHLIKSKTRSYGFWKLSFETHQDFYWTKFVNRWKTEKNIPANNPSRNCSWDWQMGYSDLLFFLYTNLYHPLLYMFIVWN